LSMSWKQNFGFCQGQTFEVFEFYIWVWFSFKTHQLQL
jgi:hypothetical protein